MRPLLGIERAELRGWLRRRRLRFREDPTNASLAFDRNRVRRLVVPVLAINKQTGMVEGVPDLITRGLVIEQGADNPLRGAALLITEVLESASLEERTDYGIIRDRIGTELRRYFRKRLGQRPLVLPVIMEI